MDEEAFGHQVDVGDFVEYLYEVTDGHEESSIICLGESHLFLELRRPIPLVVVRPSPGPLVAAPRVPQADENLSSGGLFDRVNGVRVPGVKTIIEFLFRPAVTACALQAPT
eukprot:934881-Rhodomonas_salina.1